MCPLARLVCDQFIKHTLDNNKIFILTSYLRKNKFEMGGSDVFLPRVACDEFSFKLGSQIFAYNETVFKHLGP